MEHKAEREIFLDTLMEPAFLVREGTIVQVNKAAADLLIRPGEPVAPLMHTGATEYAGFRQGNMYLTLDIGTERRSACVMRMGEQDLFRTGKEDRRELTALSLAASQLREPLSKALLSAERLCGTDPSEDALRLNRGLYQMLRILGNMADAAAPTSLMETVDISTAIWGDLRESRRFAGAVRCGAALCAPREARLRTGRSPAAGARHPEHPLQRRKVRRP